jgi:hypothetical protein
MQLAFLCSVVELLVTVNVVPGLQIHLTLMMEKIRSSEKSFSTKATLHHNPENGIHHSHCRGNL